MTTKSISTVHDRANDAGLAVAPPLLTGRFGIVLPHSQQVVLFGTHRLWAKRVDAEFHLFHSRGYATPESELHSAYVGELGKDFWLDE